MEEQLQRSKVEIQEMDGVSSKVETFLKDLEAEAQNAVGDNAMHQPTTETTDSGAQAEETAVEDARRMWDLLDKFDGT